MGQLALIRLLRAGDGTTAVEYAVLVSLVLLVCIGSINAVGQSIARPVQDTAQQLKASGEGGVTVKKSHGTSRMPRTERQSPARN